LISRLKGWLPDRNAREVLRIRKHVLPNIENEYRSLQQSKDLQEATLRLRSRLKKGDNQDELLFQAFALVKEAVRRTFGLIMHDVQLTGGWLLCQGKIAEMMTGEGKTVTSLLPAYWFGLQGKGVHMITVNEYLARRDCEEMGHVFQLLGLTVGLNMAGLIAQEKKLAYLQDITYGTCTEFGFDYLRDHMVTTPEQRVQRGLAYALIDEIDSVLIDEARTPLIIASKSQAPPDLYQVCARFLQRLQEKRDYEVDWESRQVMFTESAVRKIEAIFRLDNLYEVEHATVYHYLLQGLRAKALLKRDIDYMVADNKVHLIDAFTGRVLEGRQFSEGLHQAIEAKERVPLSEENRTCATITVQKLFSLYDKITGMSGTISTDTQEIRHIYGLDVVTVPTHKPGIRHDEDDLIFPTIEAKVDAVVEEILHRHVQRQPVLIGTTSVRQSEILAKRLAAHHVPFQLLNAKSEDREAEMIAGAGLPGAITIATNMAGRGTDIRLGEGVPALGGLHIIGTERHESRRIDNQLRGRAGRQGDPGSSQFLLSLEDELVARFAFEEAGELSADWPKGGLGSKQGVRGGQIQAFMNKVQQTAEMQLSSVRSMVFRLDAIVHEQRQAFYRQRDAVLLHKELHNLLSLSVLYDVKRLTKKHCPEEKVPEEWDLRRLQQDLGVEGALGMDESDFHDYHDQEHVCSLLEASWTLKWHDFLKVHDTPDWQRLWRAQYLSMVDSCWLDHLETLQHLKQGIHYHQYAQKDPVQIYQDEAWRLFERMSDRIHKQVSQTLMREMAEATIRSAHHRGRVV